MCGIIGVTNSPAAAEEIFLGLQNLQHRGQDGGGIVTYSNGSFYQHRGGGLLDIAFPAENFKKLLGKSGVGHTRYATIGNKEDLDMLQPFYSEASGIVIGHNGNILNYHSLKSEIIKTDPQALASGCDSEMILWSLSKGLETYGRTPEGLKQSIRDLSQTLVGSYSVIGYAEGIGLFAFRDPQGLRPLMMGQRQEANGEYSYAFASETMALEFISYEDLGNVEAGEVVIAEPGKPVFRAIYAEAPKKHCMFEWVYFARVESHVDHLPVYQARFNLGITLAEAVKKAGITPDIVVPVPETSRISAIALAEALNVPFREVLIKNRYVNRTFILESQAARQEAIRRKLTPVASELKGKKVLIVDDSIVRGNTSIKIIDLLRKCGAEEIYFASSCPPIQYPCYYGVDFPDRDELLAGKFTQEELKAHLGVDALIYQSMEGLRKALHTDELCDACLTGDYPTDVSEASTFSEQRTLEREVVTHA